MTARRHSVARTLPARALPRWVGTAGYLGLGFLVLALCNLMLGRLQAGQFVVALVGILVALVYSVISFRHLPVPFFVWILAVGGFRFLWSLQTPVLPDLYVDRMAMIWLGLVFMIKQVAERKSLRGPFLLDCAIAAHGLYMLVLVYIKGMAQFHSWTMSVLIPYAAFFLAKNIILRRAQIRSLLWVLLALSVYYNVTAVCEKYDINALLWPKYIVGAEVGFTGRSVGPFLQAPLFGTVIGMLLPIHLYFLATVRRPWARLLLLASLLVGLAGLYFTYTRGSWLAGIVALGVAVYMNRKAYFKYMAPAAVLAPIIAVAALGLAQDEFMKERVENEDTIGARLGTAVTALRMWQDYPIFGVGFYEYQHVRDNYIAPVDIPGMPLIRFVFFRHNAIHDIYLGPLAETGIVGMGLQAWIYALVLRTVRRKYMLRKDGDHFASLVLPVFAGLLAGYMVGGLVIDYRFFSVVGTLFMVCAGIADGYRPQDSAEAEADEAPAA